MIQIMCYVRFSLHPRIPDKICANTFMGLSLPTNFQTSSASTVLKPNFCYLVSNPNWTKFTIQHLPSVIVLQSVPHPQLAILVSSLMPISPFPIRFLHLLARASTTSGISDATRKKTKTYQLRSEFQVMFYPKIYSLLYCTVAVCISIAPVLFVDNNVAVLLWVSVWSCISLSNKTAATYFDLCLQVAALLYSEGALLVCFSFTCTVLFHRWYYMVQSCRPHDT